MAQTLHDNLTPRHSVVFNTLLAFVVIISVSLLSMLGSLYMADALQGDAAALNQAGSLRMQSYRLAMTARSGDMQQLDRHIAKLEETLVAPALQSALSRHSRTELPARYTLAVEHWKEVMHPLISVRPPRIDDYREEVGSFVDELDALVKSLQEASESRLEVIRGLQVGTLFIIVIIAFLLIYGLHNNLATPLRTLTAIARDIGRGQFNRHIRVDGDTELSLLARTINQMSQELAGLYADMEDKVHAKTLELQHSNSSLQLLFDSARMLYGQPDDPSQIMGHMLAKVQGVLGCGPITLCLNQPSEAGSHTAMTSQDMLPPNYCNLPKCDSCPALQDNGQLPDGRQLLSFSLRSGPTELGSLRVEQRRGHELDSWQKQLLETLADLFAASLSLSHQSRQQASLALMEERAVIARELHDSLAQALSAQKLQLARLRRQMLKDCSSEELGATLEQIEQGLNAAYRQLRELLTTFRIQVNAPGLKPALLATVQEFSQHSGVAIELDYQLDHCPLTPNEEIHCLQIIREALSNVIKHAQASRCNIQLQQDSHGTIDIRIEDDGIGIGEAISPGGHYGLTILHERAASLHGTLAISNRNVRGTRVWLRFPPQYRHIPLVQETTP